DWRTVVVHTERESLQSECACEILDGVGQVLEGVGVLPARRGTGETEARQVRRDDVVAVGQRRDDVAVHVRGGREPVQQQDGGRGGLARLPVEHFDVSDLHLAVVHLGRGGRRRYRGVCGSGRRTKGEQGGKQGGGGGAHDGSLCNR